MALPLDKLGTTYEPLTSVIDGDRARAYAAATNDDNPAYTAGKVAPPVFGVVPTWETFGQAVGDVVPPESAMFIVHGEQDMHFHQPLIPGRSLTTRSDAFSVRVGSSGTRFTIRARSDDADTGQPVLTQYNTVFIRGMSDGESGGPDKPGHDFPEAARSSEVGTYSVHVDDDQTYRYRDASGDFVPIHVDNDIAKSVGLPGIIIHGLCTMAFTSWGAIQELACGDPTRLKRLAVRFSKPLFPGQEITTRFYGTGTRAGRSVFAYETTNPDGELVIKDGLAEVS